MRYINPPEVIPVLRGPRTLWVARSRQLTSVNKQNKIAEIGKQWTTVVNGGSSSILVQGEIVNQ